MKYSYLTTFVLAILIASCSLPNEIKYSPQEENFYVIDFSDYSQEGFFISPEKPTDTYIPIGMIDYRFVAAAKKIELITGQSYNPDGSSNPQITYFWVQEDWEIENCMDTVVKVCKSMGANALFNFEILPNTKVINDGIKSETFDGIRITGFAIKREE